MSPRRPSLSRLRDGEDGVTLVIVVLSLIALLGMTVLVVDVGSLLWHRRSMVNAADAAALSAAKTCSLTVGGDPADPAAQGDAAAAVNEPGLGAAYRTEFKPGPTAATCTQSLRSTKGSVTVTYRMPHDLYFAPVLGFGQTNDITTSATAAWGSSAGGSSVPLVLQSSQFQGPCDIPLPDSQIGQECWYWYDNGDSAFSNGTFGLVNLDSWGVDRYDNNACNNSGGNSTVGDYVMHDFSGSVTLIDPLPNYVCKWSGHGSTWEKEFQTRLSGICGQGLGQSCTDSDGVPPYDDWPGASILIPVNDCTQQVDNFGNIVSCQDPDPDRVDKYAITGFATLELEWVLKGNDNDPNDGSPAAISYGGVAGTNGTCGVSGAPLNFDAPTLAGHQNLGLLADVSCGGPTYVGSESRYHVPYADVVVTKQVGPVTTTFVKCPPVGGVGCQYRYNDQNAVVSGIPAHTLQWIDPLTQGLTNKMVRLTWSVDAVAPTPGKCGFVTSDPNALCIGMIWRGYTSEPGPIGGQDFGTRSVILCSYDYSSCPPGTKPTY